MEENVFFVYAIYNTGRNKIYIGQTSDIEARLRRHNGELESKKNSYSKLNSGEWELISNEEYSTRKEALKREKELKSAKGREFVWNIVKSK